MLQRYGLKEGFASENQEKIRVHHCAMRFQQRTSLQLHENVVGYQEDRAGWILEPLFSLCVFFVTKQPNSFGQEYLDEHLKRYKKEAVRCGPQKPCKST